MKANKGFTLIELSVVLAVIAVLAAILTPLVTSYIDQARETRTASDVRSIAQALNLHRRDTGQYPIYNSDNASDGDVGVEWLVGEGTVPTTIATWDLDSNSDLDEYLNTNKLGLVTSARGGRIAFRGPYLDTITADPWGNSYIIYAQNLERASGNAGFVLSAGPDGTIDSTRDQTNTISATGDDIIARIK